jgi:Basophilic leukemia-expressed protein Bles03
MDPVEMEPEENESEALSDVAYGLFEVLLNRGLRSRGPYLFELVEKGVDFQPDFHTIFGGFRSEYPPLADALIQRFGSADAIYARFRDGEGVIPSKTTLMYWIVQDAPGAAPNQVDDEKVGKWLIFLEQDQVDEGWRRVRDDTCAGLLGFSAKVSTAKPNPESRDLRKVIYVYTKDWADETDVMRVRERLRERGFTERIGYKRNIETFRGEYSQKGKKVTFYSA